MLIFLDESGDLGWSFDKPHQKDGSSRFITIAGIAIEQNRLKFLNRFIDNLYERCHFAYDLEKKGSRFSNEEAASIVRRIHEINQESTAFRIVSITAAKQNVAEALRRDKNVFYNFLLNRLLTEIVGENLASIRTSHAAMKKVIKTEASGLPTGCQTSFGDTMKIKCMKLTSNAKSTVNDTMKKHSS